MKTLQDLVAEAKQEVSCISPEKAHQLANEHPDALLIDVREPSEAQESRASNFINIPRGILEMKISDYSSDPERPILLHCATSGRAAFAAQSLGRMGYHNVHVIDCSQSRVFETFGVD